MVEPDDDDAAAAKIPSTDYVQMTQEDNNSNQGNQSNNNNNNSNNYVEGNDDVEAGDPERGSGRSDSGGRGSRLRRSSRIFGKSLRQSLRRSSLLLRRSSKASTSTSLLQQQPLQEKELQELNRATDANNAEQQQQQQPPPPSSATTKSTCRFWLDAATYLYSLTLLGFSMALVVGCIVTHQATGTAPRENSSENHNDEYGENNNGNAVDDGSTTGLGLAPAVVLILASLLLAWLAIMEGGQGALVGLKPIERDLYTDTHPVASRVTALVHGNNDSDDDNDDKKSGSDGSGSGAMERFIVGRQFLVVLVVFGLNALAAATPDASLWNLPDFVRDLFLGSGLALIVVTLVLGQLVAQVNAADCMLDFVNNRIVLLTARLALVVEALGLMHCSYLVQILFGTKNNSNENNSDQDEVPVQRSSSCLWEKCFFWLRVVISLALLGFSFAVTLTALLNGQTSKLWDGASNLASILLFLFLMCLVGMMEGMQIALFAVINTSEDALRAESPVAYRNCRAIFGGEEAMQAFLIGRQICVTACTFLIARITTINVNVGDDDNIFGVSDGVQSFFNTGLLGAVITTVVASLVWRIVASTFPVAFLANPLVAIVIRVCLFLERSGICSAAWVLARAVKAVMQYEPDEVYLDAAQPTNGGAKPITERDEEIDRLFLRSSIASLHADMSSSIRSLQNELVARETGAVT